METVKKKKTTKKRMKKKMKIMTYSLTEDLLAVILERLPLKCIAAFKLVCKQWKSIAESQFLRELFFSHHQNSHSSWSVMWRDRLDRNRREEVVAHYGCDVWGLPRSLGSYVTSFINGITKKNQTVGVVAYTDVGLILISSKSVSGNGLASYYVANPISRQFVEIPLRPKAKLFRPSGLVARIENGDVLGYKIVLMHIIKSGAGGLRLLIYSSETCLWSFKTLHSSRPLRFVSWQHSVSTSGNLHWLGTTSDNKPAVVSHDFYATGTESDPCRVTIYPDVDSRKDLIGVWTSSQGFAMYTNILREDKDDKLKVWRLMSGEWEHVSQISSACFKGFGNIRLLAINPFDGETLYLWSEKPKRLVSTNLYNNGKLGVHNKLERTSDGLTLSFSKTSLDLIKESIYESQVCTVVLPRWLYRIPSSPSS